jgi:hypothetical protein
MEVVVMKGLLKKSIVLFAVFPLISLYASNNISFRGEEERGRGDYHPQEYNRTNEFNRGGEYRPEGGYGAGGYYHPEARGFEQGAASGYEQGANQNQNPVIIEQQPQTPENPYSSNPEAGY